MKYIKKFDSVADMTAALASSTISVLGMAMNGNTPVLKTKVVEPVPPTPSYSTPFYVENITQQSETLTISCWRSEDTISYLEFPVEYSTDSTTWSSLGTTGETALEMTLEPSDKVYLRATTNTWYNYDEEDDADCECTMEGVSKVGGNIMSLLYGSSFTGNETAFPNETMGNFSGLLGNSKLVDASELILPATTLTEGCYGNMFSSCESLTSAPALPATTLADYCYDNMFSGCASLTTAPTLPATTLANNCYQYMFNGCISLTSAPVLPATTLAQDCYNSMFISCTALTTAPTLPATTLAYNCYYMMFNGCISLTSAPVLPATTLADGCYSGMFYGCTSLTTAPALPATTLADGCYNSMFNGCTALTTAPTLPATTLAIYCYCVMFNDCISLTSAPALPATTLADGCYNSMFNGCTALTTAPTLPATTLAEDCYDSMFNGCTNLNYIKCLATNKSASNCTQYWVRNIASTGTFVKNPSMSTSTWGTGNNGIPSGWTVEDATEYI